MGTGTATESVVQVLGNVTLFHGLPRRDLERIAGLVQPREIRKGEFLFREGDVGDRLYVVHSGAVEVLQERPLGDHERLATKGPGDGLGELSLLTSAPRSASVRALEATRLLSISRADFDRLLGEETFAVRLLRAVARAVRILDLRFPARNGRGDAREGREVGKLVLDGLEPRSIPRVEGFQVAGGSTRHDTRGGASLWDVVPTAEGRTLLSLMDVKGTGLPPAYLIGITRALLHEIGPSTPVETLLSRLNRATFRNLYQGLDECVELALVELGEATLRWSCAGDRAAMVLRRDGSLEEIATHGPPLGILPQFDYGITPLDLAAGETLLAFTEAPVALVQGAVELARGRRDADATQLAALFRAAFRKVQSRGAEAELAFLVVRRRP